MEQPGPRKLAARLAGDDRLRRIALLAGKFKRIAMRKQKAKVKHGQDEVTDVEMGSELSKLLPVELAGLLHPRRRMALMRDLVRTGRSSTGWREANRRERASDVLPGQVRQHERASGHLGDGGRAGAAWRWPTGRSGSSRCCRSMLR